MTSWIKRHRILTGFLILVLLARSAFYVVEVVWFKSLIPDVIETEWWPVAIASGSGFEAGSCSASFTLKEETLREIEEKGLAFFKRAKEAQPRYPFREMQARYYGEWKETPLPIGEGIYDGLGFECGFIAERRKREIADVARMTGGYYAYSHGGSSKVLVLPKLKTVMFIYR